MIQMIDTKRRPRPVIEKTESSYYKKFMTARLNLEFIQQEQKFSSPTKEIIDTQF